jgi:hypothetical protein
MCRVGFINSMFQYVSIERGLNGTPPEQMFRVGFINGMFQYVSIARGLKGNTSRANVSGWFYQRYVPIAKALEISSVSFKQ